MPSCKPKGKHNGSARSTWRPLCFHPNTGTGKLLFEASKPYTSTPLSGSVWHPRPASNGRPTPASASGTRTEPQRASQQLGEQGYRAGGGGSEMEQRDRQAQQRSPPILTKWTWMSRETYRSENFKKHRSSKGILDYFGYLAKRAATNDQPWSFCRRFARSFPSYHGPRWPGTRPSYV